MKTIFEILPAGINAEQCVLMCAINDEYFSYAIKDVQNNMYVAVAVYNFDKSSGNEDSTKALDTIIQNQLLLSANFKKVCILYSFAETALIPFALYNSAENNHVLDLLFGDINRNTVTLTDLIAEKECYNTYRVPVQVLKLFAGKFPDADTMHQHSILLKQPVTGEDKLFAIFYAQEVVVRLTSNSRLEFINNFYYATPEDVSYILLNICAQHGLTNVSLEISGFIEKDSVLYKEIYKYFEHVSFAMLPDTFNYSDEILEHPAHYFNHIFAIDSCG